MLLKSAGRKKRSLLLYGEDGLISKAVDHLSSNGGREVYQFARLPLEDLLVGSGKNGDRRNMIVYPFSAVLSPALQLTLVARKFEGCSVCNSLVFYKNRTGRYPVEHVKPEWLINGSVSLALKSPGRQRCKRLFDIFASLIAIALTAPLMLIIAAAVKLTSKGPVFYIHERLGLNGKPFRLCKFRTMVQGAEASTGPVWAQKQDPRATPVGLILRRMRLDELPQFFNVLKGEMSLVGPRPIRQFFAERLAQESPYYPLRFSVKPGITGWAQVMAEYGDTVEGQLKKLEYDLFYILEYSFLLDAKIIWKTVRKVLSGAGQ